MTNTNDQMKVLSVPGVELRPVPGFFGVAAGDDGHIYSFQRRQRGKTVYSLIPRRLPDRAGWKDYLFVDVYRKGHRTGQRIHRLVASAFHGPCPEGYQGSHKDHDKSNNKPSNLAWETPKKNNRRSLGLDSKFGSGTWALTDEEAQVVIALYRDSNFTIKQLAKEFNTNETTISDIVNRRTYKKVDDSFRIE